MGYVQWDRLSTTATKACCGGFCVVAGCNGIMSLHEPLEVADAPHTLEWPWHATWVCEQNSAHIQVIANSEYAEIRRLLRQDRL
jgi:hypothetical protein